MVDGVKEEVVEEPDVSRIVHIESVVGFQIDEKVLPLSTKPFSDIIPDSLNPAIVYTPG